MYTLYTQFIKYPLARAQINNNLNRENELDEDFLFSKAA